jgi:hypothetical protein
VRRLQNIGEQPSLPDADLGSVVTESEMRDYRFAMSLSEARETLEAS